MIIANQQRLPSAPPVRAEREHRNIFNLLRLLLAITVIGSHAYPLLGGLHSFDLFERLTRGQHDQPGDHPMDAGHAAVYAFFVISGFLIAMSWERSRSLTDYLRKRILRIHPGFIVALFVCVGVFGPAFADGPGYWHDLRPMLARNLYYAVTLGVPHNPPLLGHVAVPEVINGSLWTIRYEFDCYLILAVIGVVAGWLLPRVPAVARALPLSVFLIAYGIYAAHCAGLLLGWMDGNDWTLGRHHLLSGRSVLGAPRDWPRLLTYYAAGMCLYAYRYVIPRSRLLFAVALVMLIVSVWPFRMLAYTLPVFGSYALLYVANSPLLATRLGLSRIGSRADLSYGIYLYGWPVEQSLVALFGPHLTPLTLFLLAMPLASLLALVSWKFVEEPCLRLKPRPQLAPAAVPGDKALHQAPAPV